MMSALSHKELDATLPGADAKPHGRRAGLRLAAVMVGLLLSACSMRSDLQFTTLMS